MSFKSFYLATGGIWAGVIAGTNLINNDINRVYYFNKKPIINIDNRGKREQFPLVIGNMLLGLWGPILKGAIYGITFPISLPKVIYDKKYFDPKHYQHFYFVFNTAYRGENLDTKLKDYFDSNE